MRKASGGFETIGFAGAGLFLFLSAATAYMLRPRLHLQNARVQFGVEHLPWALAGAFGFTVLVALSWAFLARAKGLGQKPTALYLLFLTGCFFVFWLPSLLAGGFDEDDWMLLAAASIRKIILVHPGFSWHALDAVDGNFRPLGTVLYFGYLYHWFGLSPLPYLTGLFLVNLLGALVGFAIVRELGYSRIAGAAASLLYLSRSMTYPIHTWPAALGDALVILLCGLSAVGLLKAIKTRGSAAAGLHLLAWACFFLATLAKQSSFAFPLVAGLVLLLRPGLAATKPLTRRALAALLGVAVYGATAGVAFFHAKALSQSKSPYPIAFSGGALLRVFGYPTAYFGTFEFPSRIIWLNNAPSIVGIAIVLGVLALVWKVPAVLGERPRDVAFCALAAVASISLFILLSDRVAPYYGSMSAFWMSLAIGIGLTRFGPPQEGGLRARVCCFAFCVLLVTGFTDIRLKQTGLFPSGGYIWGTFSSSFQKGVYDQIASQLAASANTKVLVLTDMPGYPSYYTSMAWLEDPHLQRILVYDSEAKTYMVNDLQGRRPQDGYEALNDAKAYNWIVPLDTAEAAKLATAGGVLRLKFHKGKIVAGD